MIDTMPATDVSTNGDQLTSLPTAAARNLATTTKTVPQMQEITSRWLLRLLPWVQVPGGTYRVNRRLTYTVGDGRVAVISTGERAQVVPETLREVAVLRGLDDPQLLAELGGRFVQRQVAPGEPIVTAGRPAEELILLAHGRAHKLGHGQYGEEPVLSVLQDGDHFGDERMLEHGDLWPYTVRAQTACVLLVLAEGALEEVVQRSAALAAHLQTVTDLRARAQNRHGEALIELAAGHHGERVQPQTFADYELNPRQYELSVAQTVLRVHTRVADLYNEPMNQLEQQLRLTIEALRERQEDEMLNNPSFGLLHNADSSQRIFTRTGPPTPDDMDELLSKRRKSKFYLAHPRTIAAFGRECSRRHIYPETVELMGRAVHAWRGVPILPCDKIPISDAQTSPILCMRVGEEDAGVVGLRQTGIPDEYEPGLSVRFMSIDEKAVMSYQVSAYFSVAVLVPDALGVLEDVEIGHIGAASAAGGPETARPTGKRAAASRTRRRTGGTRSHDAAR